MIVDHQGQTAMSELYLKNLASPDTRYAQRGSKAKKIAEALREHLGDGLASYRGLDIGCATGALSRKLAPDFRFVVGIDVESALISEVRSERTQNLAFAQADGSRMPFDDGAFDVVICAQVYEHAVDPQLLASEAWRVLRPGGICFFSGPNKWAVVEEHYWLPFLSWLPAPLSDAYMRLFGRGSVYDVRPFSYWRLRELWRDFHIEDYTLLMIRNPERFSLRDKMGALHWMSRLPVWILRHLLPFVPNFNWILVKPHLEYTGNE